MSKDRVLFKTPSEVFERQLDNLFAKKAESEVDIIFRIISLVIHNDYSSNTDLRDLFRVVDLESFIRVISVFENRTVKFPSKSDIKDSLMLALCYYYHEIEGMSWEEIKAVLPFEVSSIAYGIKIKNFDKFLTAKLNEYASSLQGKENKNGRKHS